MERTSPRDLMLGDDRRALRRLLWNEWKKNGVNGGRGFLFSAELVEENLWAEAILKRQRR
jgi:hypothetical protein